MINRPDRAGQWPGGRTRNGGVTVHEGGSGGLDPQEMPLGQRLYDNWLLLLVAGLVIMVVIYTGWGMWEIATMPMAELP
jgi:hypothetical protein